MKTNTPINVTFAVLLSIFSFSSLVSAEAKTEASPQVVTKITFKDYVTNIKKEAIEKGISKAIVDEAFKNVEFLHRSVKSDKGQPEFKLTLNEYIPRAVPDWKVKQARDMYQKHYQLLHEIGNKYGVQPRFIVALWGIETNFGRLTGNKNIISALTTMAYDGRRETLFKTQLFAALTILEQGNITSDKFIGSWAGAMGQVQFMPTSYLKYAVDYDGDGRKDIWGTPADVFASAANYLKTEGWIYNETWGRQVTIPAGFDVTLAGIKKQKSLAQWKALGVRRFEGSDLPNIDINASIIIPDDKHGRIYLAYNNYRVLMHWNRSYYFATAVSYLSERINHPTIQAPVKK